MSSTCAARAIVVLIAVLAGCTGQSTDVDDDDLALILAERQAAHDELAERLDALEAAGVASASREIDEHVLQVEQDLEAMRDRIDGLAEDLLTEGEARLAFAEAVDEMDSQIRSSIADLRDATNALQAQVDDLQVRYEVLQQRIDRMQQ